MIVWLTGLSGAGKSTLSEGLAAALISQNMIPLIIDGDRLREELCRDLGFSDDDRKENIRRASALAIMAAHSGIISICSLISPLRSDRDDVKNKCKNLGITFLEIYISTSLSVCEKRDPKGLYRKAREGLITQFTGIDSTYEPPINPDLIIQTEGSTIDDSIKLLKDLVERFLILKK